VTGYYPKDKVEKRRGGGLWEKDGWVMSYTGGAAAGERLYINHNGSGEKCPDKNTNLGQGMKLREQSVFGENSSCDQGGKWPDRRLLIRVTDAKGRSFTAEKSRQTRH